MTIRNLPDATRDALKARAKRNGRSAEAEARAILEEALRGSGDKDLGAWLSSLGPAVWDDDIDAFLAEADHPVEPPDFS